MGNNQSTEESEQPSTQRNLNTSNSETHESKVTGQTNQLQSNGSPPGANIYNQRDGPVRSPIAHRSGYQMNGFDSPLTRRHTPQSSRHRLDTSLARLPYSPGSMFDPNLQSPLHNIHIRSSPRVGISPSSTHRVSRSRIGLIPTVKFQNRTRGTVRIPKPDKITPQSPLSVFSRDRIDRRSLPSTEQVLSSLRQKSTTGEKRKRDSGSSLDGHIVTEAHRGGDGGGEEVGQSNNLTDMNKRRKPNTSSGGDEFVEPSTPSHTTQCSQQQQRQRSDSMDVTPAAPSLSSRSSPRSVRDGHLRTAIASSYSSSRRASQKRWRDDFSTEEPLYKKSINISYLTTSRSSSRHASPVHFRDDDSETGSRVSVTPLPSLKNSPRCSPLIFKQPVSDSPAHKLESYTSTRTTTKIEPRVVFPKDELPLTGFVATLEDRAHDEEMNARRVRALMCDSDDEEEEGIPSTPQIVMPIVTPVITIPDPKPKQPVTAVVTSVTAARSMASISAAVKPTAAISSTTSTAAVQTTVLATTSTSTTDLTAPPAYSQSSSFVTAPSASHTAPGQSISAPAVNAIFGAKATNSAAASLGSLGSSEPALNSTAKDSSKPAANSGLIFGAPAKPSTSAPIAAAFSFNTGHSAAVSVTGSVSSVPPFSFTGNVTSSVASTSVSSTVPSILSAFNVGAQPSAPSAATQPFQFGASQSTPAVATGSKNIRSSTANTAISGLTAFGATSASSMSQPAFPVFGASKLQDNPSVTSSALSAVNQLTQTVPSTAQPTPAAAAFGFGSQPVASDSSSTVSSAPSTIFGSGIPATASGNAIFGSGIPTMASGTALFGSGAPAVFGATVSPSVTASESSSLTSVMSLGSSTYGGGATPSASTTGFSFGTGSNPPAVSSSAGFAFGATNSAAAASAAAVFGGGSSNPTAGIFGASQTSTASSVFSTTPNSAPSNVFGGAAASSSTKPSVFSRLGAPTTAGSTSTSQAPALRASGIFGTASSGTSVFGATSAAPSATANTPAALFGGSATASASTAASALFGASQSTPAFGSGGAPSAFGSSVSTTAVSTNAFGQPASTAKTGFNFTASAPATSAFGANGGAQPTFGSSASTPSFGSLTGGNAFGSAPSAKPFGSATTNGSTPAFGSNSAASASSIFGGAAASGAPSSTPFGGGFGSGQGSTSAAGVFGSASAPASGTSTPVFGGPSTAPQPSANPFGGASSTGVKPAGFNFGGAAAPTPAFDESRELQNRRTFILNQINSQLGANDRCASHFTAGSTAPAAGGMFSLGTAKSSTARRRTRR